MPGGGVLAPLRRTDFLKLWSAQTISIVGDKIHQVGLSIMVFQLTDSYAQMGLVLAITFLPAAMFGLVAGSLVDRFDRRRTMIVADIVRAALVIMIPFAARVGLPAVYLLAFGSATASLFFEPSRMALVPSLVDGDELMAANALDMTTMSVAEIVGIGFGGALVTTIGYSVAFWIDGLTFVLSALCVASVAHRGVRRQMLPIGILSVWDDLKVGIARIRENGALRGLMFTYVALAIGGGAAVTLTILMALKVFIGSGLSPALRLTVVDLATTVGLLVGSIAVGSSGSGRAGLKYLWGSVVFGLLLIPLYAIHDLWLAAAFLFAAGIANEFFGVPMLTIIQTHSSEETRGRVFAVRTTIVRIGSVIGLAGAGAAAQSYGVLPMMGLLGVYFALIGVLGFAIPQLRDA